MTDESELKKQIKVMLKARGAYVVPVAQGAYSKIGDPDMVACYKGRFLAIEGKTYEGRVSDWQVLRMRQVEGAGGIYVVVRTVDAMRQALDEIDARYEDDGAR